MSGLHALMTLRAPEPGRIKTRLAQGVGDAAALALYRAFVADELTTLDAAGLPVTVFVHPPEAVQECEDWLGPDPAGRPRRVLPQRGAELGQRMANAFRQAFEAGAESALLVGGDLPELSRGHLDAAVQAMATEGAALAPSHDGGYTLVAFTRESFAPDVFEHIEWSTARVLEQTLYRFKAAGQAVALLPPLPDIDTADDLAALAARWRGRDGGPAHTLAAMETLPLP